MTTRDDRGAALVLSELMLSRCRPTSPAGVTSVGAAAASAAAFEMAEEETAYAYTEGQATLRSSAHRAVYSKTRKDDPGPRVVVGALPSRMRDTAVFGVDGPALRALRAAVVNLLDRAGADVGSWPASASASSSSERDLEDFVVPAASLKDLRGSARGKKFPRGPANATLAELVVQDAAFLAAFDALIDDAILPNLRSRLAACGGSLDVAEETSAKDAVGASGGTMRRRRVGYVQRPPTLRIQPGPSTRYVRPHSDDEYGHQDGEINFWMPFTSSQRTRTTLWVESERGREDYAETGVDAGECAAFHGTSKRHMVPANESACTRVSLDFRIGVEGFYDPKWVMRGTKADHDRREVSL